MIDRLPLLSLSRLFEQIEPSWKYSMASTAEYLTERTNYTWNVDWLQRGGLTARYATDGIKGNKPK